MLSAVTADTILTFIRHGESQAQVEGILPRHDACAGLSKLGRQQAVRLAERLKATGELSAVTVVYTSVIERAK